MNYTIDDISGDELPSDHSDDDYDDQDSQRVEKPKSKAKPKSKKEAKSKPKTQPKSKKSAEKLYWYDDENKKFRSIKFVDDNYCYTSKGQKFNVFGYDVLNT